MNILEEFSLQLLETALSLLGNENGKGDFYQSSICFGIRSIHIGSNCSKRKECPIKISMCLLRVHCSIIVAASAFYPYFTLQLGCSGLKLGKRFNLFLNINL